jgi:hypothetical protein
MIAWQHLGATQITVSTARMRLRFRARKDR